LITKVEGRIPLEELKDAINVFGHHDENLQTIEKNFNVTIVVRDNCLIRTTSNKQRQY